MCNLCEYEDSNKYMDTPIARKLLFLLTAQPWIALIDLTSFFKSQLQNLILGGFLHAYTVSRPGCPVLLAWASISVQTFVKISQPECDQKLSKENSNFLQDKNLKHRGMTQHVKFFSELDIERFHSRGQQQTTPTGLVRTINMSAASLSKNNNMAAVTSCQNALFFPLLLVLKLDSPTGDFNWAAKKLYSRPLPSEKITPLPTIAWQCNVSSFEHCSVLEHFRNCGRQEEPAILILRLLSRMRRMYVASIDRNSITRVSTFYPS